MAPSKSVPAAFHSELSEYASLLRAIRTNSTLDIVPQLSKANPRVRSSGYDSDQGDSLVSEEDAQLNDPDTLNEASEFTQGRKVKKSSKGKAQGESSSKTAKRSRRKLEEDDNWTRWPLLKEHCPLPEWTFDEEVMAVAEQCLRFQTSVSQDPKGSEDAAMSRIEDLDGDDINDFTLSPAHLSGLTLEAASKLTSILSLLASHRPSATFTKHGRLAPMSWLDVLEVVGMAGIFDLRCDSSCYGAITCRKFPLTALVTIAPLKM